MEAEKRYLFIVLLATSVIAELTSKLVKLTANLSITKPRLDLSKLAVTSLANLLQLSFLPLVPIKEQQPLSGL